uniref:Ribosomal protein L20 n=1 Tax=Porolithon onkodes TaxID=231751 RepID=A0A2Z2KXW5_9FLOR|nr:ribosomal protein L20 [Porolithon onkodes]ASB29822.1 ribosomal protein L20 [Porolithon onkodes]
MYLRKETKLAISRKKKKLQVKKASIFLLNSNSYLLSVKYSYVTYFFKCYNMKISTKLISNLLKEELGFVFSLNNFITFFCKKTY